jgi:cell division protein FtsB
MKNNIILNALVFLIGVAISAIAAYYSIIGLTSIFAGAFWPIVIMGTALEAGKLVAVSWLYNNWNLAPLLTKAYLTCAIVILMLITSMGIFGFLSKAHIEQQLLLNTGVTEQIEILDSKIKIQQETVTDIETQIAFIDDSIKKMIEKGRTQSSLNASETQKGNRKALVDTRQTEVEKLSALKVEKIKLESEFKKLEAEVGPIKYVAELIYGSSDTAVVEKSIRWVIIMLIFVFDPLAVLLMLAFNISMNRKDYDMEFLDMSKIGKKKKKVKPKPTPLPFPEV